MFESFSSRTNQSAVDRLIQMATGKKTAGPVEEKPAAPEAVEQPQAAEASVAVEEPPVAEAAPEAPVEAAPEAEAEAPAEAVAETPVESAVAAPEPEEVVDARPFHEPEPEAAAEVPAEAASAPVVEESAPVEAAQAEAVTEPEAEAPVETVASPEPVGEESAPQAEAAAEAVAESAAPATEEAVEETVFPEEATETPAEEAAAEAKTSEETAGEEEAAEEVKAGEESTGEETAAGKEDESGEEPGAATEMRWGQETPVGGWMSSQRRTRKLPLPDARERGSLTTEEYRRLKAERRRSGADVVPSPEETSYLKMGRTSEEVTEQELRRMSQDPMWKTLVQFKGWLPVVTSLLPVLDMASGRSGSETSDEMKDTMDGLLMSHRDVRATLQNQTMELKRVEEEVAKLRDSADKTAFEQTAMSDDVRSMQRMVKNASLYLGILLGLLVAVVGYMAFLVFSYLNHPVH